MVVSVLFFNEEIVLVGFLQRIEISFFVDGLGKLFLSAVLLLYNAVTVYAMEYMKNEERKGQFFAFFFLSLGALISVCTAKNLITMYLCFELATLSSMPMVLHERSRKAVTAGLKYLFYSIAGALLGLLAVFFVYQYSTGNGTFVWGGFLDTGLTAGRDLLLQIVFFLGIVGFGAKAGLFPLHGWLPSAHPIAPAPASSLLSGIIAKAGIFAIIRLVYYSIGTAAIKDTWVQITWMILAIITVFMGSMLALVEKNLKKRLAYSTISQLSYIMLGLSLLTPEGLEAGLLHVLVHVASKGGLFLVAGAMIVLFGKRQVSEMKGIGQQIPLLMIGFTVCSLSLIGIPPAGRVFKQMADCLCSTDAGSGDLLLADSGDLTDQCTTDCRIFTPVIIDGFFPEKEVSLSRIHEPKKDGSSTVRTLCSHCFSGVVWN